MQITDWDTKNSVGYSWHPDYDALRQFINITPSIEISSNKAVIPSEVQEEFYRLFDATRTSFVKEHCPAAIECGLELSRHYKALCTGLLSETGLSQAEASDDLRWFLEDPVDGLRRFLSNPLFKLLGGQIGVEEFTQIASDKINSAFATLFHHGYQRWVSLAIIRRLLPEGSYRVPAMDAIYDVLMGEGHERPGQHKDEVPEAKEVQNISFEQHPIVSFIVPCVTVHSRRTGAFAALHTDFHEAEWTARRRSSNAEWYEIAALKAEHGFINRRPDLLKKAWYELEPILPDLALYTAGEVNDLALIADFKYMLRPSINLAIMESPDLEASTKPDDLKRRLLALRPRHGAFIICRQALSEATVAALGNEDDIKVICAGYDEAALEPIISLISPQT